MGQGLPLVPVGRACFNLGNLRQKLAQVGLVSFLKTGSIAEERERDDPARWYEGEDSA